MNECCSLVGLGDLAGSAGFHVTAKLARRPHVSTACIMASCLEVMLRPFSASQPSQWCGLARRFTRCLHWQIGGMLRVGVRPRRMRVAILNESSSKVCVGDEGHVVSHALAIALAPGADKPLIRATSSGEFV